MYNNMTTPCSLPRICWSVEVQCNCFVQTFYLLHEEGFFVGASSGLNVAAAVEVNSSDCSGEMDVCPECKYY